MEPTPPAKSTTPPPPPPPPLLRRLVAIDTKLSQQIHILAKPFLPHFLLLLLELSADFRLFFPVALSLLAAPLLSPGPGPNPNPNPNPNSSPIQLLRPFLSPLLLGLLLDLALIGLIKFTVRRARPVYNKNMSVAVSVDHFSFPSGHASRVCFVAALFYLSADALLHLRSTSPAVERWIGADQDNKAVSVLVSVVWAWAAATSISRILLGRHFVSDVFAGACLGVVEGVVAFHFLRF
ncbi:probable lipid phosphate phosphatase beta isoform X1 [Rosa rugosa]|uniref:probable lipid phosphate phosphatase beta isoform X1 n=1 Tax=Rosa rugosa TaxID=74645 RepID=UPI002B40E733|nr:probable lipid phosphate phosphatase beta isoform X1 [Rosa rugosa]XP_062030637.1 probable lipid phosphate phosphatase beta isoform X1 [Rosa rugosa]XP_062030638.1 probable lipid phosphate phosphatase beta isoform X1 [Rosa rugosa]XP_062030639.1 probable lipid phosphate phosphatase beta isoform X1 [Rosa rugosa]XP_062030640.1 probable lipid phosphate phosphatase beta isoform X1 [Rosa rugosa]XP_062030641.1 probable lipid phosphate phosphatase beta isoform X1 [Rosa rugosa]